MSKKDWIMERLKKNFSPTNVEVIDESARHKGHQGVADGATETHFRIRIQSPLLADKSRLQQHRLIYAALDMQHNPVHALAIEVLPAPDSP